MDQVKSDYLAISRELEKHHAVFYTMWEMGRPVLSEEIPTAAVVFDQDGHHLNFLFNPKLWAESNDYDRSFIIAHECLHVLLNHGLRARDAKDPELTNMTLDVVVNHTLVNSFGFDRRRITNGENYCWVDNIFPDQKLPDNECFEFYYNRLAQIPSQGSPGVGKGQPQLVDDHQSLADGRGEMEDLCRDLNRMLSDGDKEGLQGVIEKHFQHQQMEQTNQSTEDRGDGAGGIWTFANVGKVKKKKKWETVIKQWALKFMKNDFRDMEQWARRNRRFSFIGAELMLPTEVEIEDLEEEKQKIQVWFFQDTSASCSGFVDRFFRAAMSLPEDKFDIRLHCFDTRVYETTLESKKLYGFGGTSFHILENYIQKTIAQNNEPYPKAVFVITDGYGTNISPEKPECWYWFLSTTYRYCIPSECNIYNLSDFE